MKFYFKCFAVLQACFLLISCQSVREKLETDYFEVTLTSDGYVSSLKNKADGKDFAPKGVKSPLMRLYDGKTYFLPVDLQLANNNLLIGFENGSQATVAVDRNNDYIKLTLLDLTSRDSIKAISWGPFSTTITKYIGETICVVRDEDFSIGMQALTLNTMDGLPDQLPNTYGGNFIDPLPGQDVPAELKDSIGKKTPFVNVNAEGDMPAYHRVWRGTAAFPNSTGSELRLYSKNWRNGEVLREGGGQDQGNYRWVEPIDVDYIGTSVALFGCPEVNTLDIIEQIELNEGLPHPMVDGVWLKRWEKQDRAYMLYEGQNMDNALNYADSCDFELIHIGDFFASWGHFDLKTKRFPGGAAEIRALNEKARARGKRLGVHTLTMFTQTHDPYVTPVPSDSLGKIGSSVLTKDVSPQDTEIFIENPEFFHFTDLTRTVKIGKELIAYRAVSADQPYRLLDCTRGQFNTKVAAHTAGTTIDKLQNDCYHGFYADINLTPVIARRLADVVNETTIGLMDFDGLNGDWQTGHGPYGTALFLNEWYNQLNEYPLVCGSSVSHYFWHIYRNMNWGEPWYDDLRHSQVNYRLENQRYFKRNLMPGMLGWFKLEPTYRPEDIEWIQARSAGFDAGYLIRVDEGIEVSGFKSDLFSAIREWQDARNSEAFTAEQLVRLQNPANEFHLEKQSADSWNLYDVTLSKGNIHKYRAVQTGEPLLSKFTFQNPYEGQPAQFYIYVKAGEDKAATIKNLTLEIEGYEAITLPVEVQANDKIYCDGKSVYICDTFWKPRHQIALNRAPEWIKGQNNIIARGEFSGEKAPAFEVEFKALGNSQTITKTK